MEQLDEVHCKHHKLSQLQLTRLMSKIRSKSSEVFSIFPNRGKYIANIGETIYHFPCPRKILRPIFLNDNKCYNNLTVQELDKNLVISNNVQNHTLFLTPFDRTLSASPEEVPCIKNSPQNKN